MLITNLRYPDLAGRRRERINPAWLAYWVVWCGILELGYQYFVVVK